MLELDFAENGKTRNRLETYSYFFSLDKKTFRINILTRNKLRDPFLIFIRMVVDKIIVDR